MQFFALSLIPIVVFVVVVVLIAKTMGNATRLGNVEWELKKLPTFSRRIDELERIIAGLKKQLDELQYSGPARKKDAVIIDEAPSSRPESIAPTPSIPPQPIQPI